MTKPAPDYAALAARALAAEPSTKPSPTFDDRSDIVAAMQAALRARQPRRVRSWLAGAVAAAAMVALALKIWPSSPTTVTHSPVPAATSPSASPLRIARVDGAGATVTTNGLQKPASWLDHVEPGALITGPEHGSLMLQLLTGTEVKLGPGSRTQVSQLGDVQRFVMHAGKLEARVAKLGAGKRFIVATADADVEVKGTRFTVDVGARPHSCMPGAHTQVTVHEGTVVVRNQDGEVRINAGEVWPPCPTAEVAPVPTRSGSPDVRPTRAALPARRTPPPPPSTPALPAALVPANTRAPRVPEASQPSSSLASSLAEQNDLFAAALAARRRGDIKEALFWIDDLLQRYPGGQLAASARAERQRLRERMAHEQRR